MLIVEVVFLIIFWSWFGCSVYLFAKMIRPNKETTNVNTKLEAEPIQFKATDGVKLSGSIIHTDPNKPWIILTHGLGSNRKELVDLARQLRDRFNLFLFDFRAHGKSAGLFTSFGWREQHDLEGALAYLGTITPPKTYGIYGKSLGGEVALLVGEKDDRLAKIAVQSPENSLETILPSTWWRKPQAFLMRLTYRLMFGISARKLDTKKQRNNLQERLYEGDDIARFFTRSLGQTVEIGKLPPILNYPLPCPKGAPN